MKALIFDIETSGLDFNSEVYMIAVGDLEGHTKVYLDVKKALEVLDTADLLIGFNIIGFDIPVLETNFGWRPKGKVFDVMLALQLYYRDMWLADEMYGWMYKLQKYGKNFVGRHSLAAWGYRLGVVKGSWDDWNLTAENKQDFMDYNEQDVIVTRELYKFIQPKIEPFMDALDLEQRIAQLMVKQQIYGFMFNKKKAQMFLGDLYERQEALLDELRAIVPPKKVIDGYYRKNNAKRRIKVGDPKVKIIEFNPNSREQVAEALQELYGWKPIVTTKTGLPKLDKEIAETIDLPIMKKLTEYWKVQKLISALIGKKQKGVLHFVGEDERIHGKVHVLGAKTRRMSHSDPNVAQTPRLKEFRELFIVPEDKVLIGVDVKGLEARGLAHYLYPYDKGNYAKQILETDIHTYNQQMAGLQTRQQAKRFLYAFMYGAGVEELGGIAAGLKEGLADRVYTEDELRQLGSELKKRFFANTPGMKQFINDVYKVVRQRRYIKMLDGVPIFFRKHHEYKAVNYLIQSAGAILTKRALLFFDEYLQNKGLKWGEDYAYVANVHDEFQIETYDKYVDLMKEGVKEAFNKTQEYYKFRIPLEADVLVGKNWAETH